MRTVLSALDMFSIGIGPSSSHTVGPMRAARLFVDGLAADGRLDEVARVRVELYGSLGATGRGHGSDAAVILGLLGEHPETVDTATVGARVARIAEEGALRLGGIREIVFRPAEDVVLHLRKRLPGHPNGMTFEAFDARGASVRATTSYSVGGGFVADDLNGHPAVVEQRVELAFPFATAAELLEHCRRERIDIADVMLANEHAWRPEAETRAELLRVWRVMRECVDNGCTSDEELLPGSLRVRRRAPGLFRKLDAAADDVDAMRAMDWVNLYALAVNEENAAGGRVVTAPTNGAAGIVPAVLHYADRFVRDLDDDAVVRFLLTAAAIGILFKRNASISGAEVGCQGEVGSACSMAAAGLCALLGGTPEQVENAAEIGIEHHLGLTCDPIGGLVQIPCIERNAIASSKAINAARIAMHGDGTHHVSLDQAVTTMRETGADMKRKYKETSLGGLAVNVIEC
ncbi:L-serine dehydratase [Agromyces rhizosphaerae]|uniref:L-serine dehydratase n=2 Tax=Agromyces rhizosphaerae TaxID=88374 RepID=A0A9W6CYZ0_9MICO|nr:L-serine dehydratase [Agromyces rhizosphaerae]